MAEDKKDVNVSLCTGNITPETPLQDELKRLPFAKSIAALIQKNAEGKIVIGIEGEWGEGKTYTIELIRREIEAYNGNKEKPIAWMVFNPWHFTDRQHLSSLFLRDLAVFIEERSKSRLRLWVEKNFLRVGRWLVFIVRFFLTLVCPDIATVLLDYAKLLQPSKDNQSPKPLETLKKDITKKLLDKSLPFSHIVVAVEDMDRLNPEEIRAMLQLMKMIADFPKITYLLAYDRTHVVNALGDLAGHHANRKEAREYGEGYLKKVVQAAYALPAPGEDAIANLTLAQFKKRAKEFHGADFDQQEYFQHVWFYLKRLMPTLRVGERIVNRAASMLLMLEDKCNPADVLLAAYLMEFQPKLWSWLCKHYQKDWKDFDQQPIDEKIKNMWEYIRHQTTTTSEYRAPAYPIGRKEHFPMYVRYELTPAGNAKLVADAFWEATTEQQRAKLFESLAENLKATENFLNLFMDELLENEQRCQLDWDTHMLPLLGGLGCVVCKQYNCLDQEDDLRMCFIFSEDILALLPYREEPPSKFWALYDLLQYWAENDAKLLVKFFIQTLYEESCQYQTRPEIPQKFYFEKLKQLYQ